jgi:hypothetical protein
MPAPRLSLASRRLALAWCAFGTLAACSAAESGTAAPQSGGSSGSDSGSGGSTGASSGSSTAGTSSAGASGGSQSAGASASDASSADAADISDAPIDGASDEGSAPDGGIAGDDASGGSTDYGGIGQLPLVPLQYTAEPVPPIVAPECPGDPTEGFTEYKDSFVVQRPYDLAATDRFSYENGIYTFWIMPGDKPHAPTSNTAPRTEARYSDMKTGQHIWSGDVMFEASLTHTAIFQIHSTAAGEAVYLQSIGSGLGEGAGPNFITNYYGKWFNLKVVFDAAALSSKVYINNCLKISPGTGRDTGIWYFKNGVYGCGAPLCRDHYKNIHLYQLGSSDVYGVKSPYP